MVQHVFHAETADAYYIGLEWGGSQSLADHIEEHLGLGLWGIPTKSTLEPAPSGRKVTKKRSQSIIRKTDAHADNMRGVFKQIIAGVCFIHDAGDAKTSRACCHLDLSCDDIVLRQDPGTRGIMTAKITEYVLTLSPALAAWCFTAWCFA